MKRVRPHVNPLSITHQVHFEGFENNNAITIDVGAYKGEFTEALAQKFPNRNFLAMEVRPKVAQYLEEKFQNTPNVTVLDGDAGLNFRNILEPQIKKGIIIDEVFINFPDPWFKDKHHKRRFITAKFLESLTHWWPPKTPFIFQTDQPTLFEQTVETLQESAFNRIEFFTQTPYGVPTDWERAKVKLGIPINRMKFWLNN